MKRKLAVGLVIALMLSGCAAYKIAKSVLCNPTQGQIAEAEAAMSFIDAALALIQAKTIQEKLVVAKAEFFSVSQGLCVFLDRLEAAIAAVDEAGQVVEGQAKIQVGAFKMVQYPRPPDMPELRAAVK